MKCSKEARLAYTQRAKTILAKLTLEEKVHLMSGNISLSEMLADIQTGKHYNYEPYEAGGIPEKGVSAMRFCDGPRGVVCGTGKSTCFPVSMNRGASFDIEMEERIGRAIGKEIRAHGGNLFGGVCINLPYNPGWGRSQEVYGEESFALGHMGSALVRGVQDEQVIACIKHFAFNSMEISRFQVSVDCSRRTEREVYLPHFKDCIDAGAASVMSAYNRYRGVYCGHSDYLLRKVLKEEWDFDGFVMSDFIFGIRDTFAAANNGMDIEMCNTNHFGEKLINAVQEKQVDERRVDEAALRIIRTILAFEEAYQVSGKQYGQEVFQCEEHKALALEAAQKGIVLLQNKNSVLPLKKEALQTVLVLGKLSSQENIGDHGSSWVFPGYTVTPLQGLQQALPNAKVLYCDSENLEEAKALAEGADAVVFIVGYNHDDEGEYVTVEGEGNYTGGMGGDRANGLGLHADEVRLIQTVGPVNKNSVAVLIGGNMITVTPWKDCVSGIFMAFYPGQEGGTAIAQLLLGDVAPSAKLPFVLPYREEDLPQVAWKSDHAYYDYYHGYAKLEKEGIKPLLPYGFGLSYTSFTISNGEVFKSETALGASCTVENTGNRKGAEVVQLYVGFQNSALDRPVKLLRGFQRVTLSPGESRRVTISCPVEKLQYFNPATSKYELERMEYSVYIGNSSAEEDLLKGAVSL